MIQDKSKAFLQVSVDMQVIVVYAKAGQNFTVEEKMIDNRSMFQTGEAQLGEAILKAIKEVSLKKIESNSFWIIIPEESVWFD